MKKLLIFLILSLPILLKAQNPEKFDLHRKIAREACVGGKGNATFRPSLSMMEKVLLNKMSKKSLDKTLPQFTDEGNVTFSYNDATKDHDIPSYEITYVLLKNGNPTESFIITIEKDINNAISGINLLNIPSLKCDKLIQSLLQSGYMFRSSISNYQKKYYSDKKRNLEVTVARRRYGGFNFNISKL